MPATDEQLEQAKQRHMGLALECVNAALAQFRGTQTLVSNDRDQQLCELVPEGEVSKLIEIARSIAVQRAICILPPSKPVRTSEVTTASDLVYYVMVTETTP